LLLLLGEETRSGKKLGKMVLAELRATTTPSSFPRLLSLQELREEKRRILPVQDERKG
jgi:hypothetical protein